MSESSTSSNCSERSSSCSSSSIAVDDEKEQAYWKNLVQKALNKEDGNNIISCQADDSVVSSTQDESDVSSLIYWHRPLENCKAAAAAADAPAGAEQEEEDQDDDEEDQEEEPADDVLLAYYESPPMPTIPFVSINVQKWEEYYYNESTERAQVHNDDDDAEEPDVIIREVPPPPAIAGAGVWTHRPREMAVSAVREQQRAAFVPSSATATIPSQIYISIQKGSSDSSSGDSDCCSGASIESEYVTLQTEILDPTEPLIYGSLEEYSVHVSTELREAADALHGLLVRHLREPKCTALHGEIVECIQKHPDACQVRYPPTTTVTTNDGCCRRDFGSGACYPLSYFCATGCLEAVRAAHAAYPEAIGCADACLGLPLAYACHHGAGFGVVEFLVRAFPDAVRRTDGEHRTPLHLACCLAAPDPAVVRLLADCYPAAVLLPDRAGFTPLLAVCQTPARNAAVLLPLLLATSPLAVSAVTGASMEKALHVAAFAGADRTVLGLLLEHDPGQCRCTDDSFQLPLHKAVIAYCRRRLASKKDSTTATATTAATTAATAAATASGSRRQHLAPEGDNVALLVAAFPDAVHWTDTNDETPSDIACRMLGRTSAPLLRLLKLQ